MTAQATMLQTEKPSNAPKALTAFRLQNRTRKRTLAAVFEHGQLWITDKATGAIWSVVDTDQGFDFEQVSQGDED